MFFCRECDNIYDVTNSVINKQVGIQNDSETPTSISDDANDPAQQTISNINDILTNILNDDAAQFMITQPTYENVIKSSAYKKLSVANKAIIDEKLENFIVYDENDENNKSNKSYFICDNCGYNENIPDETIISSKSTNNIAQEYYDEERCKEMMHIKTLPLTRNYVCVNSSCESHDDHSKREAVFFRMENTYAVRYICKSCSSSWT